MARWIRIGCVALTGFVVAPAAYAQGTLAGVVRDSSGGVLPGVTVEASSPALIEKVRSTVTDDTGQYRIVDMRGGTYTVTFTLPGFATVKREGVGLAGEAIVTVNADMRVGELAETITVVGEAPTVDIQSTTRQQVMTRDVIDVLPTGRNYTSLGQLLPGVNTSARDTGGAGGDTMSQLTIHGSRPGDQRVMQNGVNTMTLQVNGDRGIAVPNPGMASEVTIDTSGLSAEQGQGGIRINYIPRDGGNTFSGFAFVSFANEDLQGNNLTDDLRARGLPSPSAIKTTYDVNPGFGGPIRRDRVWFYFTGRVNRADQYPGGAFVNLNGYDPTNFTVVSDTTRRAYSRALWTDAQFRLTTQVSRRNKVAFTWDQQTRCSCLAGPGTPSAGVLSATVTPEAATNFRSPTQRLLHGEWSSPVNNRILVEAAGVYRVERWGNMPPNVAWSPEFITPAQQAVLESGALIPVLDLSNGRLSHGNFIGYNNNWVSNSFVRATVSYVAGGHQVKAGFSDSFGYLESTRYDYSPYAFFINIPGAPPFVRVINQRVTPLFARSDQDYDLGVFVQDRWTVARATVNLGLRYDSFKGTAPAQVVAGRTPLTPNRADIPLPETPLVHWHDVTPRLGLTYDLAGDGKTALKVSLNKYVEGQAVGSLVGVNAGGTGPHPVSSLVNATSRTWLDLNGDFVPQCDLTDTSANGECLAVANPGFGSTNTNALRFDRDAMFGWGKRGYNWEIGAGVQREILPRVSVEAGYFRRWYGNFRVMDNLALGSGEFTAYTVTAPAAQGLSSSGRRLTAFDPNRRVQAQNLTTRASTYGDQLERWNGADVTVNARSASGVILFGGISTGKTTIDSCDVAARVPESLGTRPLEYCRIESPFLTQVKLNGAYTLPRWDVTVSATFQSVPGPVIQANYVVTERAPGQPLVGSPTATVALLPTTGGVGGFGTDYGERLNQLDLRVGKLLRVGATRTAVNVDIFNLFNGNAVTAENPSFPAAFRRPTQIVPARFVRISAQVDF
ncbi:MAG: TonB-dependent receptor [Acidobacteria bacterium]|nr:TonB-dependent receptor [Acidobacteriota bacterium]